METYSIGDYASGEDNSVAAQIEAADRAAASPWISYCQQPWWQPLALGLYVGVNIANMWILFGGFPIWVEVFGVVLALAQPFGIGAYVGWEQVRRGTWPRLRSAPPEFRSPIGRYFAALGALIVVGIGVWLQVHPLAAALVAAVGSSLIIWWYNSAYERAADRLRHRVG